MYSEEYKAKFLLTNLFVLVAIKKRQKTKNGPKTARQNCPRKNI